MDNKKKKVNNQNKNSLPNININKRKQTSFNDMDIDNLLKETEEVLSSIDTNNSIGANTKRRKKPIRNTNTGTHNINNTKIKQNQDDKIDSIPNTRKKVREDILINEPKKNNKRDILENDKPSSNKKSKSNPLNKIKEKFSNNKAIKNAVNFPSEMIKTSKTEIPGVKQKRSFNSLPHKKIIIIIGVVLVVGSSLFAITTKQIAAAKEEKARKASKITAQPVDSAVYLQKYTIKNVKKSKAVPAYSFSQIQSMDLTKPSGASVADLKQVTSAGLVGLEEAFIKAEKKYHVNAIFVMSIASLESAKGTIMFKPNNMFGYGSSGFSSKAEGIYVVSKGLGTGYLNPSSGLYGGSKTLKGVNKRYASSSQWANKVGRYMQGYYSEIRNNKIKALNKIK